MNMDARTAFAESITQEMDMDLSPELMAACDKALMQLWLRGYAESCRRLMLTVRK